MGNRATIQVTKFVNLPDETESTIGYRIYDDYGQSYCNTWDEIPEELDILLKVIEDADEIGQAILGSIVENGKGIYINDTWYDWDEIKHCFE